MKDFVNPPAKIRFNMDEELTRHYEGIVTNASQALLDMNGGMVNEVILYSALMTIQVLLLQHAHLIGEIMSNQSSEESVLEAVLTGLQDLDTTVNTASASLTSSVTELQALISGLESQGVKASTVSSLQSSLSKLTSDLASVTTAAANVAQVAGGTSTGTAASSGSSSTSTAAPTSSGSSTSSGSLPPDTGTSSSSGTGGASVTTSTGSASGATSTGSTPAAS